MSRVAKLSIIILRIVVGWSFLYQGISAIVNRAWDISLYTKNSVVFPKFYAALLDAHTVLYIDYLIKGLFVIIGLFLILGIFVRIGSLLGIVLTLIFYFPLVRFPYVHGSYYLVDDHIILIAVLIFLFAIRAGEYFGLGSMFRMSRY